MYAADTTSTLAGVAPVAVGVDAAPVALGAGFGRGEPTDLYSLMADYERRLILLALQAAGGHQRRAAASLGLLPSTLSEKLRRLGLRVKVERHRERRPLGASHVASLP